jgi:hypothetical protein
VPILAVLLAALAAPHAQALRTCADRWNQANMLGWGPARASVTIRRPDAVERRQLGDLTRGAPRCLVVLAAGAGSTWICELNPVGAYYCPIRHEPMYRRLRNENARIGRRGVLQLEIPLAGTHTAPPLAWNRYPHVDGFIHPWTRAGKLRKGLRLEQPGAARHSLGICMRGSEITFDRVALRCVSDVQLDPCFPRTRDWNRRGAVVACGAPGYRTFDRFVVVRRF